MKKVLYDLETYPPFPPIPLFKKWKNNNTTEEQLLTARILKGHSPTGGEEDTMWKIVYFYTDFIKTLQGCSYKLLASDLANFKRYFRYAINSFPLVQTTVHADPIIRMVNNESVLKARTVIPNQSFLSYPSKDLVKKMNVYNRANTPDFNIFYGGRSIDAVLNELKPTTGDLVTLGVWKMRDSSKPLDVYTIDHHDAAIGANDVARMGYNQFVSIAEKGHPLMYLYMQTLFGFISDEFARPANHHTDYLISAIFSEYILAQLDLPNWNYDAIAYPSVGNKFSLHNLAIKPRVIDENYYLSQAVQFEIESTQYHLPGVVDRWNAITLVKPANIKSTDKIQQSGEILW
jgi:hypothetical protein